MNQTDGLTRLGGERLEPSGGRVVPLVAANSHFYSDITCNTTTEVIHEQKALRR